MTWFQKLYLVASEKTTKSDHVKYVLVLQVVGEKVLEVYNALTFTEAEQRNYNALVHKFKKFVEGKEDLAHEFYVFNN